MAISLQVPANALQGSRALPTTGVFSHPNFDRQDLSSSRPIRDLTINGGSFWRTKMNGLEIRNLSAANCDFFEAALRGTRLAGECHFEGSDITGVDFTRADLRGVKDLDRAEGFWLAHYDKTTVTRDQYDLLRKTIPDFDRGMLVIKSDHPILSLVRG